MDNQLIDISSPTKSSRANPDFTPRIARALEKCFKRRKESLIPSKKQKENSFFELDLSSKQVSEIEPFHLGQATSQLPSIPLPIMQEPFSHTPQWRDLTNSVLKAIHNKSPSRTADNKENLLEEQRTRLNLKSLDLSIKDGRKRSIESPGTPSTRRTSKYRKILTTKNDSNNSRITSGLSTLPTATDDLDLGLESIFQRAASSQDLTPQITKILDLQNEIKTDRADKADKRDKTVKTEKTDTIADTIASCETFTTTLQESQYELWMYQKLLKNSQSLVEFLELERKFKAY